MASNRFAIVCEEDLQTLVTNKDSESTKRATKFSVNVFRDYLKEKGKDVEFENYSVESLDTTLCNFYPEARTSKGELYKKSALQNIRYGINRHLNCGLKDSGEVIDIVNGAGFTKSRGVFNAVKKDLKRQGKGTVEHKPIITDEDLKKLYLYFDDDDNRDNPKVLQQKVFFDLMFYTGRRGRENLKNLKKDDFVLEKDSMNNSYIRKWRDESTKNHQDDDEATGCGVIYEVPDCRTCPVQSFKQFLDALNPKLPDLFQRPKKQVVSGQPWYDAVALGKNTIGSMMATISKAAKLSLEYTNHSIRATVVHLLDSGDIPSRHIMSLTGHKSEQSLKTYSGVTDENMKARMAKVLSTKTASTSNTQPEVNTDDDNASNDDACFDLQLMDFDMSEVSETAQVPSNNSINQSFPRVMSEVNDQSATVMNQCMPMISNCKVTINYNFTK